MILTETDQPFVSPEIERDILTRRRDACIVRRCLLDLEPSAKTVEHFDFTHLHDAARTRSTLAEALDAVILKLNTRLVELQSW